MYASLMSYDYQFSIYDDPELVQFSDGRFVSFPLNEENLTEILPFPIKSIRFLEHGPYRYRLRANGASQTFIDWNWNGIFGERRVRADINSQRELSAGPLDAAVERLVSHTALSLFTVREELYLIRGINETVPDSEAGRVEINEYRRARLLLRRPRHPEEAEIRLTGEIVAGDPVAVSNGGRTYLCYPVEGGVMLDDYPDGRFDSFSVRSRIFVTPRLTKPSLVVVGDAVYLFLWNPAEYIGSTLLNPTEIKYRKLLDGGRTGPVRTLRETSEFDIGLAWDSIHRQLCLVRTRTANYPNRLELLRYNLAGEEFSLSGAELVGGVDGPNRTTSKPAVIFDASSIPNGRLYLFYKGWTAEPSQYDSIYCSRSIEDRTIHSGWQEMSWWPTTGSRVAAVSFDGDIAIAYRTGHIGLAYKGTGIESGVMRDFNDLQQIREHGLKDSLESDRSR